jgi:two-component system, NarL family, response regulator LiaR
MKEERGMSKHAIRVLVVDDHPVVRKGLCALLNSESDHTEVIGEASDGALAVTQARALRPDVILMDLLMPIKSGLEALVEIRAADPDMKVLILTSAADRAQVLSALKAGANGYILKDSTPDDLIQAIEAVFAGKLILPTELAQKALFAAGDDTPPSPELLEPPAELTPRELDVLRCVAQGLSNQEIADTLDIGLSTVRSHVRNILGKLGFTNRTQAALYALDRGLLKDK